MNLRRIIEIVRYELWLNARRTGYLFATFGLPLIVLVLLVGYNLISTAGPQAETQTENQLESIFDFEGITAAGYVDQSGLFPNVPDVMQERLFRYETVAAARAALNDETIDIFYVIEADYEATRTVVTHQPGLSLAVSNNAPIEQLIYLTLAPDIDPSTLARLRNPAQFTEFNLARQADATNSEQQAANEAADVLVIQLFAMMFIFGVFLTNGYLIQSVIQEKENKLIEVLVSSVRPFELLAGKVIALSALGIGQMLVWGTAVVLLLRMAGTLEAFENVAALSGIQLPTDLLPLMFLYYILGYLLVAAVFAGIGALSNSMREGPQYAGLVVFPLLIPFYFFAAFLETPNAPLPVGLSLFPLTSPLSMIMRLSVGNVPPLEVAFSLLLLILSVIGMMWLASRLFRVQTLLSGQVPKLREIPGLLFGR